jgi:hypothetical protein
VTIPVNILRSHVYPALNYKHLSLTPPFPQHPLSPLPSSTSLSCIARYLTGLPCYHTISRVSFLPSALVSNEDSPGGQGNSFRHRSESIHISGLCYVCGVTIHVLLLSNIRIVDLGNFNPPRKYTRLGRQRGSWAMPFVGATVIFHSDKGTPKISPLSEKMC